MSSSAATISQALSNRTVTEFFAGIGLVRMGLEQDGWSVVFANDIAEDKQQLYTGHFHDSPSHFLKEDIHTLDVKKVPSATLATASFPCTDLSLAGMRHGLSGKHSSAFWGFIRVLDELDSRRPPIVLLENVAGFLTSHGRCGFSSCTAFTQPPWVLGRCIYSGCCPICSPEPGSSLCRWFSLQRTWTMGSP